MKLSKNTVLITGGSSGIGLELSKQLLELKNKVIICGRSKDKLLAAQRKFPELEIFQCDLSDKNQCTDLANWLSSKHPELNVLINNAAIVNNIHFFKTDGVLEKLESEVETNFIAPIRLIKLLQPIIIKNANPCIINTTTGLVYAPKATYPFYNATKAALHSFTQVLRVQLNQSNIKIVEVMFPAVDTPWHQGNPPKIAIIAEKAVSEMISGLIKRKTEIRVGGAKILYLLSRLAPGFALKKVNALK